MTMVAADCRADIAVAGDRLTVRTENIRVVMRGGEIVEIANRTTGEMVATGIGRIEPMTGVLRVNGARSALRYDGWRTAHEDDARRQAAQTVLRDGSTTVWLNVSVDQETQDVVIASWAETLTEGLRGLQLAVRNLDLTVGRLIAPTQAGYTYTHASTEMSRRIAYPSELAAQMFVWQCRDGGVVVYSRDDETRYKAFNVARRGDRLDVGLETEAEAPWSRQTSVPHVEWRLNAYKGDWRLPATGYRSLMAFLRPRTSPVEAQLWVGQIEAVERIAPTAGRDALEALAKKRPPARTLLYMPVWGTGDEPARRLTESDGVLISLAHELGFYVMLPVRIGTASPQWEGLRRVAKAQARDAETGTKPLTANGDWVMNPASRDWRQAVVRSLKEAFAGAAPDALLILDACDVVNDGNGRIEGRTGAQGMVELVREIQRSFPTMVLGASGMSELVWPDVRIVQRRAPAQEPENDLLTALLGRTVLWFGP
jgi:hypothetical protein